VTALHCPQQYGGRTPFIVSGVLDKLCHVGNLLSSRWPLQAKTAEASNQFYIQKLIVDSRPVRGDISAVLEMLDTNRIGPSGPAFLGGGRVDDGEVLGSCEVSRRRHQCQGSGAVREWRRR